MGSGRKVEAVVQVNYSLGEGPHWDSDSQSLLFTDIHNATVYRYHPATGQLTSTLVPRVQDVGFIVPVDGRDGEYIVGGDKSFIWLHWDGSDGGGKVKQILDTVQENPGNRLNDGKADPFGRLFAGKSPCISSKSHIVDARYIVQMNALINPALNESRDNGIRALFWRLCSETGGFISTQFDNGESRKESQRCDAIKWTVLVSG